MKTLLVTIAVLGLFVLPLVAAEDVKIDLSGSRVAVGYQDQGAQGEVTPGSFTVPDAKIMATAKLAEDVSAVIRLNFDNGTANGADYMYITLDNVINKIANTKSPVNPVIKVGRFKMDFGEETLPNNIVDNTLVNNSITNPSGQGVGIQLKQNDLVPNLPLIIGASLGFFNGNGNANVDNNNAKAFCLKVSGTMKSTPLYFSISDYGSNTLPCVANASALNIGDPNLNGPGAGFAAGLRAGDWTRKVYELDVRYDLLEGAQKFEPEKCPLWSDSKGVFRLAYGNGTDSTDAAGYPLVQAYVMIDGIYNVDKKWYVAFRYSYDELSVKSQTGGGLGKYTWMSFGGGHRITNNTILKLDYTTKAEPSTAKVDDDNSVNLILSTKW